MAQASEDPASEAYRRATQFREQASKLVGQGAESSPTQLRQARDSLLEGLQYLETSEVSTLGYGFMPLRFRRFNLLSDLVRIQTWFGDQDAAIAAWRTLDETFWQDGSTEFVADQDPEVRALLKDPRLNAIALHEKLANRYFKAPSIAVPYSPQLSQAERIAGLSKLWMVTRDHFVWFDHVPELDWDRLYLETLPLVQTAADTDSYYKILTSFMAKLKDGHTGVFVPKELEGRRYARPGIRTTRIGDKTVVTTIADPDLRRQGVELGDYLVAINGEQIDDYASRAVRPYVSSSTPQDLRVRVYSYALLSGDIREPVLLTIKKNDGRRIEVNAQRAFNAVLTAATGSLLNFRTDGIAVLRVSQLQDDESLQVLKQNLGKVIKAPALILDLRGNGGGSSSYGLGILRLITNNPLPQLRSLTRNNGSSLEQARGHQFIEWIQTKGEASPPEPLTFNGPVAMLIDAGTFSAGEDTAAVFRLMKRGPLVGEATGGSTGQPLMLDLPGGGSARICVKRDSYPDGTDFVGVGVVPDIVAARTIEDVRRGEDSVLEKAVAALSSIPAKPHSKEAAAIVQPESSQRR